MDEIWVLGATGRSGRAISIELAARGLSPVLVGRDTAGLHEVAAKIGGRARTLEIGSPLDVAAQVSRQRPAVVVNTIGPFARTAAPIVHACPPGTHYLDLTNDAFTMTDLLALHEQTAAAGSCVIPGAGFGVLGTESVVSALCADRPTPQRVRVAAVPAVEIEPGPFGSALAASILDLLPAGGRRYEHDRMTRMRLGGGCEQLTLPDGSTVRTAALPSGELVAAQHASGAAFVVAASSEAPTGRLIRAVLPVAAALLSVRVLRTTATHRLARVHLAHRPRPREFTWAHARIQWGDGTVREGWLRAGDAMAFTAAAAAEIAARLQRGEGRPGVHTPAGMFGPELAIAAGGHLILD
ncbi:hypothetical protein ACWEO2_42775 [Nocardia sp. NPDC004278]